MDKTRSAGWIGGAVVLVVAILIATYFLMYQPRAQAATATLAQAEQTRASNEVLAAQVAQLAEDFQHLAEYQTELDQIAVQIPPTARLADLTQMIREVAAANALTILEFSPGLPMLVTLPTSVVVATPTPTPTEQPAAGDSAIGQAEQTADAAANAGDQHNQTDAAPAQPTAPVEPAQIEGFVTIPVMIRVLGPYPNILAFLDTLQLREGRLFLASDVDATRQQAAEASQGRPATADGDLEMIINGYVYVLLDNGVTPIDEGGAAEEPAAPVMPGSDRNPFVPLTPTKSGG